MPDRVSVALLTSAIAIGLAGGSLVAIAATSDTSQVSQLQSTVNSLKSQLNSESQALAQAEQKLNAASSTGDLVNCTDLRNFEQNIQVSVSGTDSYGGFQSYSGIGSSSWLPPHCYKQ